MEVESVENDIQKIQEFQSWCRKIKPLFDLLDKKAVTDLEIRICCNNETLLSDNSKFLKDPELDSKCQNLYDELTQLVCVNETEAKELWKTVQEQWKELEENKDFHLTFTNADAGVIRALKDLHSQCSLRKTEKSRRIAAFIIDLRKEISEIWDHCMITDEEKAEFKEFYTEAEHFSEDLLDIHKDELKKWQIYQEKNQEILIKIKTREEMWKNLREVEIRAEDPNRFVNRGGTLLKDQNMHASLMKKLPKLETEIMSLAEKFEVEHCRKIKILGKEIPSMIEEDWKVFKDEKAARKVARGQATLSTPLPSMPLRPRQSMARQPSLSVLPGSSSRAEKRPAAKFAATPTSQLKRGKWASTDSFKGK